jgi:cytochrome c1
MRKLLFAVAALSVTGFATAAFADEAAPAAGNVFEAEKPPSHSWSFNGPFGTFDRAALQRGYQVYKEICANCHSMKYIAFRNLGDPGGPGFEPAEIKALAAQYTYNDGPNDKGEMFERPGLPSDHFKAPFPNDQAARAVNGGALPPDLSLVALGREHEHNYIRALLTGYKDAPKSVKVPDGKYYNPYYPGGTIGMPPPLAADAVTFADGTKATPEQMANDVVTFLAWTADPSLEARHNIGFKVVVFLLVLIGLFYAVKRKVWAPLH